MKKIFFYICVVCIMSFGFYKLTINSIPKIVYGVFHYKIVNNQNVKDNEIKHFDIPSDKERNVVMPNPDFLYSISFYDLSKGEVNLKGTMPDSTYWSFAFYKPNTINWYVKNDREFKTNQLDLKLSLVDNDEKTIKSPVKKGFMIIRMLVEKKDQKSIDHFKSFQQSIKLN